MFSFFLFLEGGVSYGRGYVLYYMCILMTSLLVFNTWVARISGASAPWVLPVTPYNTFLYVVKIILYLCMFGCDKQID